MEKEIFKDIPSYEGMYQVSNFGNVKSLKGLKERLMKQSTGGRDYLNLNLHKEGKPKTFHVHKLVAMAFLGHVSCGMKLVIDHIDNDKTNNNLDNLQIITNRENVSKDIRGGSSQYVGVYFNKQNKKWLASITINGKRNYLGLFVNELDASNAYQEALKNL
jgi:hypothetical protein